MTLEDYLANGPTSVAEITHESIVEGTMVTCNYLYCNYSEKFSTVDDATVAAEIHERQEL